MKLDISSKLCRVNVRIPGFQSRQVLYLAVDEAESKRTEIRQTFVISGAETGFKVVGTRSDGLKEGSRLWKKRSERGRKEDWGRSKFPGKGSEG